MEADGSAIEDQRRPAAERRLASAGEDKDCGGNGVPDECGEGNPCGPPGNDDRCQPFDITTPKYRYELWNYNSPLFIPVFLLLLSDRHFYINVRVLEFRCLRACKGRI